MSVLQGRRPGEDGVVRIEYESVIRAVDEVILPGNEGLLVCPGFIDTQVNGFGGVDYNDPGAGHEAIARSIQRIFATGVTRFLSTIITGPEERVIGALRNLAAFVRASSIQAQAIAGFHMEGPHISGEDGPRGAHPREHVRAPDTDEFERWQEAADGLIRVVTVSPEWEGTPGYIRHVTRAGVVASIGHMKATTEQIRAAVDAGATVSTHLGNGAHAMLPKTNNYIWDQLAEDRLAAAFILDGIHVPQSFLRAALRAKGVERSLLVTDAVMPATCEPGPYRLGEVDVELHADGRVTVRGGSRLAGSALRMDWAVGNAVRLAGVSLLEAISMATVTPARVCRIVGRQRGLVTGEKADLVEFAWDVEASRLVIQRTILAGQEVYRAPAGAARSTE